MRRSFTTASAVFLVSLLAVMVMCAGCSDRRAEKYPNRSIELIVPWAAGGGTDRLARFIADALQREFGQPVIVVNRTGGSGAVGHSAGALASPDGYTLTMATFELSTMRSMGISKLTWQDFTPAAQLNGDAAAIIVRKDARWKNLGELLDEIRQQPAKLKMSGTATGGAWDLARSGLLLAAGIPPSNAIWAPTQGSAPALVELLGNHIDVVCCSVPEAASQIEGGQVRVLAVLSPQRLPDFPDYPTAREQGLAYDAVGWRGIMLPKGTPPEIANAVSDRLARITQSEPFRAFMKKNGFAIETRAPDDFAAYLAQQEQKWADVIKRAGYETLGRNHDPGPRAMPLLLGSLFAGVLVAELLRSRRRVEPKPGGPVLSRDALILLLALVLYLTAMPWLGFAASTALFAALVMWRLGTKWWWAAVASAVIVASIHLLFVVLFKVQLP